ncbi:MULTISPECIES: beta-ketoacyl-[acyl-carrier-protein] synthase family protein [unclassified Streptomyces]|uniref:beta-ketoacyl-[acyl-carrier-protein] synthase family protein n=1 Tax=unclassified Streptomyces TaxID=2593676 RepID=UPI0025B5187E|nr:MULTISPECIES: beta-ketoacyl-[acyl-carrier-protein] synthase family protein [unclassified Streptomyces]MDN3247624.1 beta-ketoacyl-[acyl-carrier-protein] synthase family protein [Streptomyces sp. ZSW22]MDN3254046.1 beta-ketoacyl-[acyl-carrier-protein] synthase family protein [Streptomyces sp. MA25(2023)]
MTPDITVTGIGLITPAGVGADSTWQGLCSGQSFTTAQDPLLTGLPVDFSCPVQNFDACDHLPRRTVRRTDAFIHFALAAAQEAAQDAGLAPGSAEPTRIGVVLGVGSNSLLEYGRVFELLQTGEHHLVSPLVLPRSVPSMAAGEVAAHLDCRGPNFTVASACASGAHAIGIARDLIRSGTCDIVLAGGTESGRSPLSAISFARLNALSTRRHDPSGASRPFDRDRDGFVLSEGAAVLVLERGDHARARGATLHGVVAGYGASSDAHHPVNPHPDGRGLQQAIRAALADARMMPADVDHVSAHATSTPAGDIAEARALSHVFSCTPPVTALKALLGHALGAASAIQAACALLALRHQAIPPTANLDNQDDAIDLDIVRKAPRPARLRTVLTTACGFGGTNAALILRGP